MSGRHLALLVVLSLGLPLLGIAQSPSSEVVVRVHIINAKTGKPVVHKEVRMWSLKPPGLWRTGPNGWREKTNREGVAVYRLRHPVPVSVLIDVAAGYWEECYYNPAFDLEEILTKGITRMGPCIHALPHLDRGFPPKPGDVYLSAEHLTFWEHITHCGPHGCRGTASAPDTLRSK